MRATFNRCHIPALYMSRSEQEPHHRRHGRPIGGIPGKALVDREPS
jgi:hypothetical protein